MNFVSIVRQGGRATSGTSLSLTRSALKAKGDEKAGAVDEQSDDDRVADVYESCGYFFGEYASSTPGQYALSLKTPRWAALQV